MNTICVANHKGGVGKTHTAFHLAGAYVEQGKKVLVVDLDPQASLTGLFLPNGIDGPTIYDVLVDDIPIDQAVHNATLDGLQVVPSARRLQHIDALLQTEPDAQVRLDGSLRELADRDAYDFILIDTPPNLGFSTLNGLAAANGVVIPMEADKFSVEGLDAVLDVIAKVQKVSNPHLAIYGILISLFSGRRSIEQVYEQMARSKETHVFETRIKDSAKYRESITALKPITHYKPKTEFADAFRDLTREIEKAIKHHDHRNAKKEAV